MYTRCVKLVEKSPTVWEKMPENLRWIFWLNCSQTRRASRVPRLRRNLVASGFSLKEYVQRHTISLSTINRQHFPGLCPNWNVDSRVGSVIAFSIAVLCVRVHFVDSRRWFRCCVKTHSHVQSPQFVSASFPSCFIHGTTGYIVSGAFYARQRMCYCAYMSRHFRPSVRLSVWLSVCHTRALYVIKTAEHVIEILCLISPCPSF